MSDRLSIEGPAVVEGEAKAVLSVERGLHTLTYRWGADAAARSSAPPVAEVTSASEGIFLVCAPGEGFGMLAAPGAGLVVLGESAGTIELTLRRSADEGGLSAEFELKRVEAPRPAIVPAAPKAREPLPEGGAEFLVSAHVSLRGDMLAERGEWVCGPEAPGRIEGFALRALRGELPLEYQVASAGRSSGWTNWFPAGAYAGSRGKAAPLIGLRLRLRPEAPAHLALRADGAFLGAPTVTRTGREIELTGPSLLDPLVGLRVDFVRMDAATEAEAPPSLPAPALPGKLRVFRRAPRPAEAA